MLLIAVHPWDIHGAHEAGLRTAWINRTGVQYPAYSARPDLEATDLPGLAEHDPVLCTRPGERRTVLRGRVCAYGPGVPGAGRCSSR